MSELKYARFDVNEFGDMVESATGYYCEYSKLATLTEAADGLRDVLMAIPLRAVGRIERERAEQVLKQYEQARKEQG